MAPQNAEKTAIITPAGLHQDKIMPFGLRNSGNTYQRFIDQVTRDFNFCFACVDDILSASHSLEKHKRHLRILLDRFRKHGIVLNKVKCKFGVSQLTFSGHHIFPEGFQPITDKAHTVLNFPKPQTLTQLRLFLGMLNYYKRFIPSYAETARPLNGILSLTKRG